VGEGVKNLSQHAMGLGKWVGKKSLLGVIWGENLSSLLSKLLPYGLRE